MEILTCSISAIAGACTAAVFFAAGIKILRKDIDHVDTEARNFYSIANNAVNSLEEKTRNSDIQHRSKFLDLDNEIEALRKDSIQNKENWMAMAERLDAQGARILDLEHRLQVSLPKLCEEQEEKRG